MVMLTGLSLLLVAPAPGETQENGKHTLIVGTRQAPPFVLKNEDGTWGGISIELWRAIATELQLTYEIRESDLPGLIDGIKDGSFDLVKGEVDAMVYDAPLLRYVTTTELPHTVDVLPATFERQDYGFALPPGSPLREPINGILLEQIKLPEWLDTLRRYLGT